MKSKSIRVTPKHARSATDADLSIGHLIRARRMEMGMSQERLGDLVGVSFQQIQKYERGTNRIGSARLLQVAAALQTDAAALLGSTGNGKAAPSRFSDFLATREGVDILNVMIKLEQPFQRIVIDLARKLEASTA
jgi:transcriptional regulator with XRE-family HTH domain